jgi:hypothetical protein
VIDALGDGPAVRIWPLVELSVVKSSHQLDDLVPGRLKLAQPFFKFWNQVSLSGSCMAT